MNSRLRIVLILASVLCGSCAAKDDAVLRVGYLQSDLHHLPAFVALEQKLFEEQGLAVRVGGVFKAGPEEMSAFGSGDLDFGYVGQAPATAAVLNGVARVQFIAQVNREGSAIVSRGGDGPGVVRDLKGRVVAIPGHATMQDFLLRRALRAAGMAFEDIRPIVLKPPEMLQALQQKNIDAFIAWQPYPALAMTSMAAKVLADSSAIWPDHPCCVLIARRSLCEARPDIIRKLQAAHEKACDFIAAHPDEALAIAVKYTGVEKSVLAQAVAHIRYAGILDRGRTMEFVDFLEKQNYIKRAQGVDALVAGLVFDK